MFVNSVIEQILSKISAEIENPTPELASFSVKEIVEAQIANLDLSLQTRLRNDFFEFGPLTKLLENFEVTEILVNGPNNIWYEIKGQLHLLDDGFFTISNFANFVDRISSVIGVQVSLNRPFADGRYKNFRVNIVNSSVTTAFPSISFRRHPDNPWTLQKLLEVGWCKQHQYDWLNHIVQSNGNILVAGPTSSGKTSVLNALLGLTGPNCRSLIVEDSEELVLPNKACLRLITREDPYAENMKVELSHLVRQSLRLRPDRIVVGEIRGPEAKDLLMALSTGHKGSWGTLHASDVRQALFRLEMLVQLGAPQWGLTAVRSLIRLGIDYIVICHRLSTGQRKLEGIYRVTSLEDSGVITEKVD